MDFVSGFHLEFTVDVSFFSDKFSFRWQLLSSLNFHSLQSSFMRRVQIWKQSFYHSSFEWYLGLTRKHFKGLTWAIEFKINVFLTTVFSSILKVLQPHPLIINKLSSVNLNAHTENFVPNWPLLSGKAFNIFVYAWFNFSSLAFHQKKVLQLFKVLFMLSFLIWIILATFFACYSLTEQKVRRIRIITICIRFWFLWIRKGKLRAKLRW